MATIVKSLRRFSAPRKRDCQVIEIAPVIMEALDNTRSRHMNQRVECDIAIAADCPPVKVNPGDILRVMVHLLDNAFEAMSDTGHLRIQVEWGRFEDIRPAPAEMIACRLTDNGCGILAANLPKIFDPFFTTKEIGDGTGLNLAISYALVQSMGGTISAQSQEGRGATFTVYLPVID
jgi:two-component system cell cycle sensor histidine kinase/response regulator CckA